MLTPGLGASPIPGGSGLIGSEIAPALEPREDVEPWLGKTTRLEWRVKAALVLVVMVAATLRFNAVGLGNDALTFQIDEEHNLRIPLALSWSDLNPHAFFLPSVLWYMFFAFDELVFWIAKQFALVTDWSDLLALFDTDPLPFFLLGRCLNALVGTATVALVYRLGRRMGSPAHGLLAAGFLAGTFLHVRDSALATTDAPTALFVLLSVLGAVGVLQDGRWRDYVLAGGAAGLATATKYNAVLALVALVVAHGLRGAIATPPIRRVIASPRFVGALLLAVVVFVALNPYLFLDRQQAWEDLAWNSNKFFREGQFIGESIDVGPAWWHHLAVSLRYGMGRGLLGLALAGGVVILARRDTAGMVVLAFAAVFYLVMGGAKLAYLRYMTPLLPILCLFAATAVLALSDRVRWPAARPWVVAGLGLLVMVEPLDATASYSRLVHHVDTRIEAARFIAAALPAGSKVATYGPSETWRSLLPRFQPLLYVKQPEEPWAEALATLRSRGVRYFLTHHSELDVLSPTFPELERVLHESATLIEEFSPYRSDARPHPVYERIDTYYVPIGGFRGVRRPGPVVRVYRLD